MVEPSARRATRRPEARPGFFQPRGFSPVPWRWNSEGSSVLRGYRPANRPSAPLRTARHLHPAQGWPGKSLCVEGQHQAARKSASVYRGPRLPSVRLRCAKSRADCAAGRWGRFHAAAAHCRAQECRDPWQDCVRTIFRRSIHNCAAEAQCSSWRWTA